MKRNNNPVTGGKLSSKQAGHFVLPMVMTLLFILIFTPQLARMHAIIFGEPETGCACYLGSK